MDDIISRAIAAYSRRCARLGITQQPNRSLSHVEGDTITLENINGVLARYRWTGSRIVAID